MLTAEAAQDRPDGISPTALDAMAAATAAQPEAALNAGHEAALDAGVQASQRAPEVASVRCAGVCTPLSFRSGDSLMRICYSSEKISLRQTTTTPSPSLSSLSSCR